MTPYIANNIIDIVGDYMKNKIKEFLLIISVFYGIVIVILMAITYFQMNDSIELETPQSFYTNMERYKKAADNIENENCKQEVNHLISGIEQFDLNGKTTAKDYFNRLFSSDRTTYRYEELLKACSISTEEAETKGLTHALLTSMIQRDEILRSYLFQYELSLKDFYARSVIEPNYQNVENTIKSQMEADAVRIVLEIVNGGDDNEK